MDFLARQTHGRDGLRTEEMHKHTLRDRPAPKRQMENAAGLHAARIILSSLCGVGIQHSGFDRIQSDTTNDQGDDDQGNDPGFFGFHIFIVVVKFSQAAHSYLPISPLTAGCFVPILRL